MAKAVYRLIKINGKSMKYHRYVMEQHIGRPLLKTEVVHHINHNPRDNRIENLKIMTVREHSIHHNIKDRKCTFKNCLRKHASKGFCDKHYRRLLHHGDSNFLSKNMYDYSKDKCSINNCNNNKKLIKGLCVKHYNEWHENNHRLPKKRRKSSIYHLKKYFEFLDLCKIKPTFDILKKDISLIKVNLN